jgi:Domain of unknown function (DUF222)
VNCTGSCSWKIYVRDGIMLEFAPAELSAHLETSHGSARSLMADALDVRHRLPELWQLILAGVVPSWKARKVAQATRHLSRSSAMHVDAAVAPAICGLPWGGSKTCSPARSSKPTLTPLKSRPRFGRRNGSFAPAARNIPA